MLPSIPLNARLVSSSSIILYPIPWNCTVKLTATCVMFLLGSGKWTEVTDFLEKQCQCLWIHEIRPLNRNLNLTQLDYFLIYFDEVETIDWIDHSRKYQHTIMLFVCHPKILHNHCLQFFLGVKMAPRETENNANAKIWGWQTKSIMVCCGIFWSGQLLGLTVRLL